jgi:hypothetical protein
METINMVKNLVQYKKRILDLFQEFLNGEINNQLFIVTLYAFEMKIRRENKFKKNTDLWFRFFKGDTLATTILNIEFDLKGSTNNYNCLIKNLMLAIELGELEIYCS